MYLTVEIWDISSRADRSCIASEVQAFHAGLFAALTSWDTVGVVGNRSPAAATNLWEKSRLCVSSTLILICDTCHGSGSRRCTIDHFIYWLNILF